MSFIFYFNIKKFWKLKQRKFVIFPFSKRKSVIFPFKRKSRMCILWLCDGVCIVYQNVNTTRRKMEEKYPADALFVLFFVCVLFALMIFGYVVLVSSVGVWLKWSHMVNFQAKKYKTRNMSKGIKKRREGKFMIVCSFFFSVVSASPSFSVSVAFSGSLLFLWCVCFDLFC